MHVEAALVAARTAISGDLVVGLLVGACIGFLAGPIVRSRLAYREWAEASRKARLAEQLVSRMERDAAGDGDDEPDGTVRPGAARSPQGIARPDGRRERRGSWRTPR